MIKQNIEIYEPKTIEEAEQDERAHSSAAFYAGGTDILPLLKYDLIYPEALVCLGKIEELNTIVETSANLKIGSMVTLRQLQNYAIQHPRYHAFYSAASRVASPQIQTTGTVGGNILQKRRCLYYNQTGKWREGIEACFQTGGDVCHQMPAKKECAAIYYSDLAVLFLALDAQVSVCRNGKTEIFSMEQIFAAKETSFGIVKEIIVPKLDDENSAYFEKYAVRGSIDFPLSNAAIYHSPKNATRVAVGAMAPEPFLLPKTSEELNSLLACKGEAGQELYDNAYNEVLAFSRPIREAVVTPSVKRRAGRVVCEVIRQAVTETSRRK